MRRKKHKQTRRATNYYRINYGFHEPYKVLLDGNFIHATRAIKCVGVSVTVAWKGVPGGSCAARERATWHLMPMSRMEFPCHAPAPNGRRRRPHRREACAT